MKPNTSESPSHLDYLNYWTFFISALYNLEDNWKDIVRDSSMLNERQQQQQTAIWELVETEVTYIHTLRVLTDVSVLMKVYAYLFSWFSSICRSSKLFK